MTSMFWTWVFGVIGGFLLGWKRQARRDSKRLNWLLREMKYVLDEWAYRVYIGWAHVTSTDGPIPTRDDIDAAMAAETQHNP